MQRHPLVWQGLRCLLLLVLLVAQQQQQVQLLVVLHRGRQLRRCTSSVGKCT